MLLRIALRKKPLKLTALMTAVALVVAPMAAMAQQNKGPPVLRDTETEQLLREYTRPILRAAGLEKQNIQMVIINQGVFNAFVADGRRIFVNYGAIMQSETPNQIIGVMAHETGHLAGGHLAKMREQMAQAQTQMIIAMLLGAGAMVAGAQGGGSNSGLANAGAAMFSAPGEMIRRNLLSYVRQQEENADKAGVKFLNATGQSARGMYETFKRFTDESLFAARGTDPYVQSHPMPAQRVAALEELARSSPYWDKKDDPALQLRHDMVRAKISAFMERQETVYRRYPLSNNSLPARYAHAISTYLHGDLRSALAQIDALIQQQPNNPYFYEVRGQALLEGGKPQEAIAPLRKAVALSNNSPLDRDAARAGPGGNRQQRLHRRGDRDPARGGGARDRSADRLHAARNGLWPKRRLRAGRSGVGPGRLPSRRQQDRARSCIARENALRDRDAGMGQG